MGEIMNLSQIVISSRIKHEKEEVVTNCDHLKKLRFSHSLPFAFTEHGAVMLATD